MKAILLIFYPFLGLSARTHKPRLLSTYDPDADATGLVYRLSCG